MKPESIWEVNIERIDHKKEPEMIRRQPTSTPFGKEGFHEKESK
jgi:hypothetical protein